MSNFQDKILLVQEPVLRYLAGRISALELVRIIDDLVAEDRLDGLAPSHAQAISKLHESLALYVPDEPTRLQEPGIYIGDEELKSQTAAFLATLKSSSEG